MSSETPVVVRDGSFVSVAAAEGPVAVRVIEPPKKKKSGGQPGNKGSHAVAGKGIVGAKPGNLNALRHGYYSRRFLESELRDLDWVNAKVGDLSHEIALIRVSMRRMASRMKDFETGGVTGQYDVEEQVALMDALAKGATAIASLERAQAAWAVAKKDIETRPDDSVVKVLAGIHLRILMEK